MPAELGLASPSSIDSCYVRSDDGDSQVCDSYRPIADHLELTFRHSRSNMFTIINARCGIIVTLIELSNSG